MRSRPIILPLCLILTLILSSCSLFSVQANVPTDTPIATIQPTVAPQTVTSQPANQNTEIPVPTDTPAQALAQAPTSTPAPSNGTSSSLPCDRAIFVIDVTIPDGMNLAPGTAFTKIWRLQNGGTCTWNTNYKLIFDSGSQLSGPNSVNLPNNVNPGQTVDLSVNLVAPSNSGSFTGFWKLQSDQGTIFGVGPNATSAFWVTITVGSGVSSAPAVIPLTGGSSSTSFAVDHVVFGANAASATVTCGPGFTFEIAADIHANNKGKVTYFWEKSTGELTPTNTLIFDEAGTKTVNLNWTLGAAGPVSPNPFHGWARIYINEPNHQFFSREDITLKCK